MLNWWPKDSPLNSTSEDILSFENLKVGRLAFLPAPVLYLSIKAVDFSKKKKQSSQWKIKSFSISFSFLYQFSNRLRGFCDIEFVLYWIEYNDRNNSSYPIKYSNNDIYQSYFIFWLSKSKFNSNDNMISTVLLALTILNISTWIERPTGNFSISFTQC